MSQRELVFGVLQVKDGKRAAAINVNRQKEAERKEAVRKGNVKSKKQTPSRQATPLLKGDEDEERAKQDVA